MKSLQIVERRGAYFLDLIDGAGSIRIAEFRTPMAMSMFCDLARKPGIVLRTESQAKGGAL